MDLNQLNQLKPEIVERWGLAIYQELEQRVQLEILKNQTRQQQQNALENQQTPELRQLFDLEQIRKRSNKQLDQLIRIKREKIEELERQKLARKQQLDELLQKVNLQKQKCALPKQSSLSALPAQIQNVVNANLSINSTEFENSDWTTTTTTTLTGVIPEMVQSSFSTTESTTSCPVFVNPINIDIDQLRPNSTNVLSTSTFDQTVTPVTSNSFIPRTCTLDKSSDTTFPPISTVAFTTTSKFVSSPTSTPFFANSSTSTSLSTFNLNNSLPTYSKLIPSTTTSTLPNISLPLFQITSTLADFSTLTSPSFPANLDKSSTTVAKSSNFDNGIEIITIDDSDDDVEEELTGLDDCDTIEDNEILKLINQIQKNFSTMDELIDVYHIGGEDIAPVGTTAAAVEPMDDFENEPTKSTDNVIESLVPETSIQNLNFGNESESVDDQFDLVGSQNDNQQPKFTSKTNNNNNNWQQIKAKCRGCQEHSKLEDEEEEPEQPQNSQASSELNEMGQNGKLRYDTDINNRATLKSKENDRGRKGNGGVVTSEQSKQSKQSKRERHLAQKRRANETPEERESRLAMTREYPKRGITNETPEERESRLAMTREYPKRGITNETPEERESRLGQMREYYKQRKANETPEERESRLEQMREYYKQRKANETQKERERRLTQMRERVANETSEQREHRMAQIREWGKQKRTNGTLEQRERYLAQMREYAKQRLKKETPEQRESRLTQIRERIANETSEQREHRLAQIREWCKQKRTNDTPEQKKRYLAQMREYAKQRIEKETPEQRESRLAQIREYKKQRKANERPEQRKCRLAKQLAIQYNYLNRKKQQS